MHVGEVPIDDALVSGLLAQCPALRGPLRAVRSTGTVNAIYRLGDEHYVRLPRLEQYAGDLRKECEWLPRLDVSMPIPEPVFAGEPTDEYPFPWAVFRWIEGEPYDRVTDERVAAEALARFVRELRALDATGAPRAGRAPLAELDEVTRPLLSRRRARGVGAGARSAGLGRRAHLDPRRPAASQPADARRRACAP